MMDNLEPLDYLGFAERHRVMVIELSVPRGLLITDEVIEDYADDAAEAAREFLRRDRGDEVPA